MIIDFHSHQLPSDFATYCEFKVHPSNLDPEAMLAEQEKAGIDLAVISNPLVTEDLRLVKKYHDFVGKLVVKHPDRLVGLATSNPLGGSAFMKEMERAINDYDLKGVTITSSVDAHYMDSPEAYCFFERVCELGIPVLMHPPRFTVGSERMIGHRLNEMVGRPFDTTLGLAKMIFSGLFERLPELKLVAAHLGGAITMLAGRLDYGYRLRKDPNYLSGEWGEDLISTKPSEYIKQIYVDTVSFHVPAIMCAVQTVGVDHVLLASDYPPVTIPLESSIEVIQQLPLSQAEKDQILGLNAAKLLKI